MIVYHGTTSRRAERICMVGFLPKKPSRRVWFAETRGYALGRARTQARRAHARPVLLTCERDIQQMRRSMGGRRVFRKNKVIAISGAVPVTVLRSHSGVELPTAPEGLAAWVNGVLGLKPYKGVGRRHPGIQRLARWVTNRVASMPRTTIRPTELLRLAQQWLPEFFEGVVLDPERLKVHRRIRTVEVEIEPPPEKVREDEALELLDDAKPKRRIRGLAMLAELEDPDLFDWCTMYLDDESTDVRLAALHTMLHCEDGHPETIVPLADLGDKRIRAAAIAALAKHGGEDALGWFKRGLKDPNACVRLETAALLSQLDPGEHRAIFELALYDPNPMVERRAHRLTAGKGYAADWAHRVSKRTTR